MDKLERVTVRLSADTLTLIQSLVDRGDYSSLSEAVSVLISDSLKEKFTPEEASKIVRESSRDTPVDMESLLTDGGPLSMDEAVKKAVSDYIRSRMGPGE